MNLGQDKCVSWVGAMLLEAEAPPLFDQGIAESGFINDWKDQLPESWRKDAALSALKVTHPLLPYFHHCVLTCVYLQCKFTQPSKGNIMFGDSAADGSGASAISNPNGKRQGKWHEKFKNTRR